MKLSTLLEIIGSGWMLLVLGVGLLLAGVGIAFSEAAHVPLWASLGGLGLFTAIVGFAIVDRGGVEAEEQVKAVSPLFDALRNPWLTLGASIVGGIVLQRLLRGPPRAKVDVVGPPTPPGAGEHVENVATPSAKKAGFSLTDYLGDQLGAIGSVAGEAALAFGIQALGVPSVKELVGKLFGGDSSEGKSSDVTEAPQTNAAHVARAEEDACTTSSPSRGGASAWEPSSNGSRRPEKFDHIAG